MVRLNNLLCSIGLRSVRELFIIMMTIATLSTILTYHVAVYVPADGTDELTRQERDILAFKNGLESKENKEFEVPLARNSAKKVSDLHSERLSHNSRSTEILNKLSQVRYVLSVNLRACSITQCFFIQDVLDSSPVLLNK